MASFTDAAAAIRARLEANPPDGLTLRWQNEGGDTPLPDAPAAFALVEIMADGGSFLAGYGGGLGANLYRHPLRIEAHVFVPADHGLAVAAAHAEAVAAVFRSHRSATLICVEAWVEPSGRAEGPDGNYWRCTAVVRLHFDQIG